MYDQLTLPEIWVEEIDRQNVWRSKWNEAIRGLGKKSKERIAHEKHTHDTNTFLLGMLYALSNQKTEQWLREKLEHNRIELDKILQEQLKDNAEEDGSVFQ